MKTKRNLKFFIAMLLLAFCTSSCTRESETPLTTDEGICTSTNENGTTVEYYCQLGQPVDCEYDLNQDTPIEELSTGRFSQCWGTPIGIVGLTRRGVAILPILITNLYLYPDNDYLLDIIIKMGPDAADTAPHLIRLLEKKSDNAELKIKIQSALKSLGEGGITAIPYLINRLNDLRNNQGSSQDIDETISYLVQIGQFQPSLLKPTLAELAKDKKFAETAKNALRLIKYQKKISEPSSRDSEIFGIHNKYCQEIYENYSNTPTSKLPDPASRQPHSYCIAAILGKRGVAALPELIRMANSVDIYLRYLAVKYIGALGDAVDTETREKIIALKDKKYGKYGEFSMDWDVNYYMLGQFPEFRN